MLIMATVSLMIAGSCWVAHPVVRHRPSHVVIHQQAPPGQVKKMTGAKSAKAYAPGQNKNKKKNK